MTIVVAHNKTRQEAIAQIDKAAGELFNGIATGPVTIANQKKDWQGSTMAFSFTGKMGFISLPLNGTVAVDDNNVTIECDLPGMVKSFIGEDKVRATVEQKVKGLLA